MKRRFRTLALGLAIFAILSTYALAGTMSASHSLTKKKFTATYTTDVKSNISVTAVSYQLNVQTDETFTVQGGSESPDSKTCSAFTNASANCDIYKAQSFGHAEYSSGGSGSITSPFYYPGS